MAAPDLCPPEQVEVRCPGGMLGVVREGTMEIKCRHWACTRGNNVTYHTVDTYTGEIVNTTSYKDPNKEKK